MIDIFIIGKAEGASTRALPYFLHEKGPHRRGPTIEDFSFDRALDEPNNRMPPFWGLWVS